MADRPFKVLGIQQIAIMGLDKSKLSRLWIDTLGLTLTGNFRSERGRMWTRISPPSAQAARRKADFDAPTIRKAPL